MRLDDIYQKARAKADQLSNRTPPPVPLASKPPPPLPSRSNPPQQPTPYWNPTFAPHIPISQHFQQETGQHGWGNNEAQNYTDDPVNSFFTPAGQLVVRAIAASTAPTQQQRFTSARLITHQKLARQSGSLVFRLTAPCARGVWPAVWLLPAQPSKWPDDGEIDVFEAWNGEPVNHSCLHWGNYEGKEGNKHRVVETHVPQLSDPAGREYGMAWTQGEDGKGGRCVWYIDGVPVMRAKVPNSTKKLSEWQVIINVAMGGDVCQRVLPADGTYDLVIHQMMMFDEPPNGWRGFENDWKKTKEGHTL